jgi:hypothetical protein
MIRFQDLKETLDLGYNLVTKSILQDLVSRNPRSHEDHEIKNESLHDSISITSRETRSIKKTSNQRINFTKP